MNLYKKIQSRWAVGFFAASFLIVMVLLLIPRLVNLEVVKQNIISRLSTSMAGELVYRQLDLRWFPQPSIAIYAANLTRPDDQLISISALKIYPKILPLLMGRVQFKRIEIVQPRLQFRLLNTNQLAHEANEDRAVIWHLRERMIGILTEPVLMDPDLVYLIQNGSIDILTTAAIDLNFRKVNAHLRYLDKQLRLKVSCESNIGREIVLSGWLQPDGQFGDGRLQIKQFRPHLLKEGFFSESSFQMIDSAMNLEVEFQADVNKRVQAELKLSGISFRMQNNDDTAKVDGGNIRVAIRVEPQTTIISLSKFLFDTPRMEVSGHMFINRTGPEIRLELSGIDIHIDALRKTALVIGGGNRNIENIFRIITGGRVPMITVSGRGRSLDELGRIENLTVKGAMAEGRIDIPGPELHLQHVKGNATIFKGILRSDRMQAQIGKSQGYNGEMTLGLFGANPPFHLEIDTLADAPQLQRILLRLVKNEKLQKELKRISQLAGKAKGRLIIGDYLDSLHISAKVSEAHFQAAYDRIPLPIEISGGTYELKQNSFVGRNINAKIGKSSFVGISGGWEWKPKPHLMVTTDKSRLDLNELHRWLKGFEHLEQTLQSLQITRGTSELSTLTITCDAADIPEYLFEVDGRVLQTFINNGMTPLAESIAIPDVKFSARSSSSGKVKIDLVGKQIRWGQSQLDVTGIVQIADHMAHLNLDVSADKLTWDHFSVKGRDRELSNPEVHFWGQHLRGAVRIKSATFSYGIWNWRSVLAKVIFTPVSTTVAIQKAELCGIPFPGKIRITPRNVELNFSPLVKDKDLEPDFTCILNRNGMVTGQYSLTASLINEAAEYGLVNSLKGKLDLKARSGRIYRYGILSKVMALLNLTEIFKGKLPDIVKEGFAYETITAQGKFGDGKFVLNEGIINGSSMTIIYSGTFNLIDETLELSVLVSPFKTIDSIVRKIPFVSHALGGRLISIPFAVNGKWSDYTVTPLVTDVSARRAPLTIEN